MIINEEDVLCSKEKRHAIIIPAFEPVVIILLIIIIILLVLLLLSVSCKVDICRNDKLSGKLSFNDTLKTAPRSSIFGEAGYKHGQTSQTGECFESLNSPKRQNLSKVGRPIGSIALSSEIIKKNASNFSLTKIASSDSTNIIKNKQLALNHESSIAGQNKQKAITSVYQGDMRKDRQSLQTIPKSFPQSPIKFIRKPVLSSERNRTLHETSKDS